MKPSSDFYDVTLKVKDGRKSRLKRLRGVYAQDVDDMRAAWNNPKREPGESRHLNSKVEAGEWFALDDILKIKTTPCS